MKKFFEEFKAFAMRGNVIDLAVGMIIGSAFGKITTSLVNDVIMPAVSMLMGGVDFTAWKIVLKEAVTELDPATNALVEKAPEIAVKYGNLIAVIVDFIILAFAIFCMVKAINTMREKAEALKKQEEAAPEPETPAEPEPSNEEKLLMEIRDLLKNK